MGRGELCAVQRERLEVIETSGASLLSLLNDLLDMSKIEADQMELKEGLPLSRPPTPGLAASFRAREPGLVFTPTKLRVLAAEDNTVNQVVLKTLFSTLGIKPTLAANGQEAVSAWRAGQFDVVLMDIQMPVMDGIRAVKLIRRTELMEGRRRTPIIAVTADATAHQKAEYLAAGMDAMVAKPIAFAELLETIDAVLGPDDETPVRLAS
jgi:CheY-like chemotaxis protein